MRRLTSGGVAHCAKIIEEDIRNRKHGLHISHIKGLADLAAAALSCRGVNTSEWIAVLPRATQDPKSRERYISRLIANKLVDPFEVMSSYTSEAMLLAANGGKIVILMLDQSKIRDGFECLMMSLRIGDRAIPIAWKIVETEGAIGFDVQEQLLNKVKKIVPAGVLILLTADRFYGTAALINWCQKNGWKYRVRLKSNLLLQHEGGEISTGEAARKGINSLQNASLGGVVTNIGILHETGHKEAWIIALDDKPSKGRVLDYGMRWGIECMFSDMKSRGFCITKTQLRHAERIERLILIVAIAIYWAVSSGMRPPDKLRVMQSYRSSTSLFKRGLRIIDRKSVV